MGVDAAERAFRLANPAFAKTIMAGKSRRSLEKALASATKDDVKALYWYATNLAKRLEEWNRFLLKYGPRFWNHGAQRVGPDFWHNGQLGIWVRTG